jgi:outer membrane murein-binding lipoprotein Lpp
MDEDAIPGLESSPTRPGNITHWRSRVGKAASAKELESGKAASSHPQKESSESSVVRELRAQVEKLEQDAKERNERLIQESMKRGQMEGFLMAQKSRTVSAVKNLRREDEGYNSTAVLAVFEEWGSSVDSILNLFIGSGH